MPGRQQMVLLPNRQLYFEFRFQSPREYFGRQFVLSNHRISEALLDVLDKNENVFADDLIGFFTFASQNKITKLRTLSAFSYSNMLASQIPHQMRCQILHCYLIDPNQIPPEMKVMVDYPFLL